MVRAELKFDVDYDTGSKGTLRSFINASTGDLLEEKIQETIDEVLRRNVCGLDGNCLIKYTFNNVKYL